MLTVKQAAERAGVSPALIYQFCSGKLHVALPDPSLVTISFDHWGGFTTAMCPFTFLRWIGRAKALVVGVCLFILQNCGMQGR